MSARENVRKKKTYVDLTSFAGVETETRATDTSSINPTRIIILLCIPTILYYYYYTTDGLSAVHKQ